MNAISNNHKYFRKIRAIVVVSSVIIISLNYYSIKILSSIRAYVNGESEYSKAQKDATRYLIDFIQTSEIKSYHLFKKELAVPIGDSLARVALQSGKPDSVIRLAALQGRNHPDDIDNLIWLFSNFKNFPHFRDVIRNWTAADRDIRELDKIGTFIYELKSSQLNSAVKVAMILNVNTINRRLTYNQQNFSMLLGEASRVIANWLIFINIFFVLFILFTAGAFARKLFAQLVESKKEIIAQNNIQSQFMSIASHELKTPITSMKASLQILERFAKGSPDSQKMHPFIFNANKQVNRLTNLVKDLLDVTKIQNGKLEMNRTSFLLNDLIREVINETTQLSRHQFIIQDLPQLYVYADATRIYQVIDNFLSNAVKYSAGADRVHVYSEIQDRSAKVCVKDFGPGIPEDKLPFLFDRFYRIQETNQAVQGLGLGLYICKEIIENHGGEIGAESELGSGSVFWFTLPIEDKILPNVKGSQTEERMLQS